MAAGKILVIDDDSYICDLLVNYLSRHGYKAEGANTGNKGMKLVEQNDYKVILCDYRLPDSDGYQVLQHVKSRKPSATVIIMTAYSDVRMAVKLIKAGAYDYVTKPIQTEEIIELVKRASKIPEVKDPVIAFKEEFITGKSRRFADLMQHVKKLAPTDIPVLIEGETGSGKEYIAKAIHYASKRRKNPFLAVDCGAIPRELANSEMFGHIKGAFTGAINDKKGFFEQANGGTIFLDEVGNLPHENQVKLLRAIQEKTISRLGDNKSIKVDVRLITASNEDLLKQVRQNSFREDLYHRLNGFKLKIPALRERKEDLLEFAAFFIKKANSAFHKNVKGIDDAARKLLMDYTWFGNIRELQNVINRAVLLSSGNLISPVDLPDEIRLFGTQESSGSIHDQPRPSGVPELKEATLMTEKEVIVNALLEANNNKSRAARILNIDRKTLYNKIKLYNIDLH